MRIRTIKPEFWTDSLMVTLPHLARLIYIALWNAADDHGYIRDEPDRLAMELMPREEPDEVKSLIDLLCAAGRLDLFEAENGYRFYRVTKWEEHQRVDHPSKSKVSRENSRKVAIPQADRRAVAEKYGCKPGETKDAACYYCGAAGKIHWTRLFDGRPSAWVSFSDLELDHFVSEARNGLSSNENLVLSCRSCNREKSTKDPVQYAAGKAGVAKSREDSRNLAPEHGTGNREQGRTSPASPKESTGADSEAPAADALADARPTPPTLDDLRATPGAETPLEQACGLLWATLAANGCRGTASHPSVVEMARAGVTVGELKAAVAEARKSNEGVLTPPYLAVIVERLRSAKATPKTRGAKWASDDQALEVKARELGIAPKAGETYSALRQRVRQLCDDAARGAVR